MSVYYCFGVDGRRENLSERMQKRISVEDCLNLDSSTAPHFNIIRAM